MVLEELTKLALVEGEECGVVYGGERHRRWRKGSAVIVGVVSEDVVPIAIAQFASDTLSENALKIVVGGGGCRAVRGGHLCLERVAISK